MSSRFRVLGRTGLLVGGHFDSHWGSRKIRGVLAALLVSQGRLMSTNELAEWVWPPDAAPKAAQFHSIASKIREAMRAMDRPPELIPGRHAYRLDVGADDVDVAEFRTCVSGAQRLSDRGDHAGARDMLLSGMDIWSDDPLADLDGDRAANWRRWATEGLWLPAQSDLMQELCALGEFQEVLRRLDELPAEYQTSQHVMFPRLDALHGLRRGQERSAYMFEMRRRLLADGDDLAAEALVKYHDRLIAGADPVVRHEPGPRVPHMLPHDVHDLVGRDDLLRDLDRITTGPDGRPASRIVSLEGQPGIGKTALAVRWAHRAADRFPGGQLYVNLHGSDARPMSAGEATARFLEELGVSVERIPTADGRAARLRSLLAERPTLVLLDNAAKSSHVEPLVDCCTPGLVVITSRTRLTGLGTRGAVSVPVPPLTHSDAAGWLGSRVGARALSDPATITELTRLCGGNALLLHLVAGQVVNLPGVPLAELADELRHPPTLLALGADADNPTGSAKARFGSAVDALDSGTRRLFTLLGAHPGPDISVQAAAAIAGLEIGVVRRMLDDLVNAYLITQPEARGRYQFHDLLGHFAALLVDIEDYREERLLAETRMLNFYHRTALVADSTVFPTMMHLPTPALLDGVTELSFADATAAISWCTRERLNLRHVIALAGLRGSRFQHYATDLPQCVGDVFRRLGHVDDVIFCLDVAIQAATTFHDRRAEAVSRHNLGHVHLERRDFPTARAHLVVAEGLYEEVGDAVGATTARYNLARILVEEGGFPAGIHGLTAALRDFRALREPGAEVKTMHRLAYACRRSGDLDRAISFALDGRQLAKKINDELSRADCLTELAAAHYDKADLATARGYAEHAFALNVRLNSLARAGQAGIVLAAVERDQNDLQNAEHHARLSINLCRQSRDPLGEAVALNLLGELCHGRARLREAMEAWSSALAIFDDLGDPRANSLRADLNELSAAMSMAAPTQTKRPYSTSPERVTPPAHQ
ncbi:MAG TPA: BTAD domain-containing putative transcriptional regulator [Pseudonocardiaceae bacterium]|jgi:tetratricopeptide (TPR) repeat protein|nr:BTAD domain-containing putative transcriptional regulator [Pseudonocardiaceae bacterium]